MNSRWLGWIIVVLILTIAISFIYVFFNGNPIGRVKARIEFEQYFSRNFTQSIEIDNVKYALDPGYYYANVHVKKNKNLQFQVRYLHKKIVDDYCENLWELDISNKLGSEVATIFNHKATLNPDIGLSEPLLKYMNQGDKIPNYFTLQKELKSSSRLSELVSSTNLTIEFSYNYSNNQAENQKLYKLIILIKKEIPCDNIDLMYKSNLFQLENHDIQQITSFDDISKYMK